MAVRAAMSDLIDYVERLVNDESNTYHSTQEIQDALDQNRQEARYEKLTPIESRASGGTITYKTFIHNYGYWENDGTILDYNFDSLSPATEDWLTGRWTFATEPTRPVSILGFTYDVYAAAVDLLKVRLAMTVEDYDFRTEGGAQFNRSQTKDGIRALIAEYQRRMRGGSGGAGVGHLVRSDLVA